MLDTHNTDDYLLSVIRPFQNVISETFGETPPVPPFRKKSDIQSRPSGYQTRLVSMPDRAFIRMGL